MTFRFLGSNCGGFPCRKQLSWLRPVFSSIYHKFLYTTIMLTEISENDEPIHHSEGKDYNYSCPSSLTFAQSGASSSPINISPPISISPPGMTLVLEQQKLEQDDKLCRVQYNIIIVNHGGNLTIEGAMVNTMIILN